MARIFYKALSILVALSMGISVMTHPAHAGINGNQILFAIEDDTVMWVKISGKNQRGEQVTAHYRASSRSGDAYIFTKGWWWKETIVLEFEGARTGRRGCVIDNLAVDRQADFTIVMYYPSRGGCSGEGGSVHSFFDEEFLRRLKGANNVVGCVKAIATAVKTVGITTALGVPACYGAGKAIGEYIKERQGSR